MRTLLALCCAAVALSGCIIITPNDGDIRYTSDAGSSTAGNQQTIRDERPVSSVNGLDIDMMSRADLRIEVRVGPASSLAIEADSNLQPLIHSDINGDTLRIWSDKNLRSNNGITIVYTTPQLNKISVSGPGRLVATGLNGKDLSLVQRGSLKSELSGNVARLDIANYGSGTINATALNSGNSDAVVNGSGRINLGNVRGERVNIAVNGSGSISASGAVQRLDANLNGSGNLNLATLNSDTAYLASNGSGNIDATSLKEVNARAAGSGRISVHGNPAKSTVSGTRVSIVR